MIQRFYIVIFFSFILLQTVKAQKNFINGYILTLESDTLIGEIADKNFFLNSLSCDFKSLDSDTITKYFPKDILGYRFDSGKYYISKDIVLDGKDSSLFFEYLIHGEIDIYFWQDKSRDNRYYASKKDSPLKELYYDKELIYVDGVLVEKELMQYVGLLNVLTNDQPELKNDILKIKEPSHKKLINFSEKYHNLACSDYACVVYEKKIKHQTIVEILGGSKIISYEKDKYIQSNNPVFGFNVYVNNPGFNERIFLGLGYIYEGKLSTGPSSVTYHNFKVPFLVGYSSPEKGLSPVFFGGINMRNYDAIIFTSLSLIPGIKYDFGRLHLKLYIDFEFVSAFVVPAGFHSTNFGLSINYKLRK